MELAQQFEDPLSGGGSTTNTSYSTTSEPAPEPEPEPAPLPDPTPPPDDNNILDSPTMKTTQEKQAERAGQKVAARQRHKKEQEQDNKAGGSTQAGSTFKPLYAIVALVVIMIFFNVSQNT